MVTAMGLEEFCAASKPGVSGGPGGLCMYNYVGRMMRRHNRSVFMLRLVTFVLLMCQAICIPKKIIFFFLALALSTQSSFVL
jgi:hypothetical protein